MECTFDLINKNKMPVKSIKIIKQGSITIEAFEYLESRTIDLKNLCGIGSGSTVTYIESDKKIIVDTGFDFEENVSEGNFKRNRKILVHALGDFDLKPEDIDIVFITHWHLDHFGNIDAFNRSEILAFKGVVERHNLSFRGVRGVKNGEKIADGVTVMYTPGHTADHASLILETKDVKIAAAGDAIVSPGYYIMDRVWNYNPDFYSKEVALDSMRKIKEAADYIIPGHGNIFKNVAGKFI